MCFVAIFIKRSRHSQVVVVVVRIFLLVPPLLVLAKLRRLDPDPTLLGVHHHVSLQNRVSCGTRLLMSQCLSRDIINTTVNRRFVVHGAVWGPLERIGPRQTVQTEKPIYTS
jgi:hypothetical protein